MEANEEFGVEGVIIEKVYSFKYLGYIITSDDDNNLHIEKRKLVANLARKDLDKMNLKNPHLEPQVKGLMIQTLIRSKLLYGLENASLKPSKLEKLAIFESNIIKQYMGLAKRCYTTPVLEASNIKSFEDSFKLRKYSMLTQLLVMS